MKLTTLSSTLKSSNTLHLAILTILMFSISFAAPSYGASAKEIDASVDVSLERFYKQVAGAKEFVKDAKALLIMPRVKKAAFIVGGEYGEGALRINGKTVDYYNLVSGSIGLQIGAEAKDIILAFMKKEALDSFRAKDGWEAGVDGNIALLTVGAGERIDTTTTQEGPIVGFVFGVKGLMADLSLKGGKFTKLDKSK